LGKIIIYFLFLLPVLADLNLTRYQDPKFLHALLQSIETNRTKSEELLLEKTLIQKILSQTPKTQPPSLKKPADQKEFVRSVAQGLQLFEELHQFHEKEKELSQKIDSLQEELRKKEDPILALQLIYHQKELKNTQQRIRAYNKAVDSLKLILSSPPPLAPETLQKEKTRLQERKKELERDIQTLKLKIERYRLINDQKSVKYLQKILQRRLNEFKTLQNKILAHKIALFLAKVEQKSKDSITLKNEILQNLPNEEAKDLLGPLFTQLLKEHLGFLKTVKLSTFELVKNWLKETLTYLREPIITLSDKEISLLQLVLALFWILAGFFIGALYKRSVNRIDSRSISSSTKTLLGNLGYYALLIIFFFVALNTLQVDLGSIALIAGALSVGIGFGLQNIVSNFVSGIILMFERSIKIGDYIEIDEHLRGRVTDIRMRSTTINTNDNVDIVIPNQTFIQNNLINWTMNDRIRRFQIPFGVAYGTDPQKVIEVVSEAVRKSGFRDIVETHRRKTRVIMTGMGDSSVDFKLFVWIKGEEVFYPERTVSRFLILIYNALYEAGIEIPFPQRDLHIRSVDQNAVLNVQLQENSASDPFSTAKHSSCQEERQ
jgi:small-conductance mechanosensitive channel